MIPILFEDEFLVIVNKPAGIASEEIITQNGHWFLVHRLDQRVSGLLIFAKTTEAITALNEMFVIGSIQKKYKAVVAAQPKILQKTLTHWLVKNSEQQKAKVFNKEVAHSKKAVLVYQCIQSSNKYHLLEITLFTGRFHQIRAQLAAINCPIVGDLKYGYKRSSPNGSIFLQSYSLKFTHPFTQEVVEMEIPNPELWQKYGF